jgi:hypothetical protein
MGWMAEVVAWRPRRPQRRLNRVRHPSQLGRWRGKPEVLENLASDAFVLDRRHHAAPRAADADASGTGGSLVIDLEALRELSQIKENPASQGVIAEIAGYMLVAGAVQLKDNASVGPLVAKAAALFAIFRQWDVWPRVHRVGLIASASTPWRTRRCWCSRCKAARPRRRRC